jgi:hypothetical protein
MYLLGTTGSTKKKSIKWELGSIDWAEPQVGIQLLVHVVDTYEFTEGTGVKSSEESPAEMAPSWT